MTISIDDFAKIELKVGTVIAASEVAESEKLIKLTVDAGEESPRTILTGMRAWYKPAFFKGKQIVFVANLEPRKMMGIESQGMIVACGPALSEAEGPEYPILLKPAKKVLNGAKIR